MPIQLEVPKWDGDAGSASMLSESSTDAQMATLFAAIGLRTSQAPEHSQRLLSGEKKRKAKSDTGMLREWVLLCDPLTLPLRSPWHPIRGKKTTKRQERQQKR